MGSKYSQDTNKTIYSKLDYCNVYSLYVYSLCGNTKHKVFKF